MLHPFRLDPDRYNVTVRACSDEALGAHFACHEADRDVEPARRAPAGLRVTMQCAHKHKEWQGGRRTSGTWANIPHSIPVWRISP